MGMFDTVIVTCPYCKKETDCQSKSGPCVLNTYALATAPSGVMQALVEGWGWSYCRNCREKIAFREVVRPQYEAIKLSDLQKEEEADDEELR